VAPSLSLVQGQQSYREWDDDLRFAKALTHKHAKSFSAGIRFFPRDVRDATYAIYAFVRLPDDIVDEQNLNDEQAAAALHSWICDWNQAYESESYECHPAFRMMRHVMRRYNMPRSLVDDFFTAMLSDTRVKRYHSYAELCAYMHGSASVVGEMMALLCSATHPDAIPTARALGEAFQMTNFLRDVQADYEQRGRIYVPSDMLQRFGSSHDAIVQQVADEAWQAAMREMVLHTRTLYKAGRSGIKYLAPGCQFGVALAADIYEAILDRIEANDYNVFQGRVHTSTAQKLMIFGKRRLAFTH
jgi:phytoene synthase